MSEDKLESTEVQLVEREPWEDTLEALANATVSQVSIRRPPSGIQRQQVVNAFTDAFEIIGGVPRLALWADAYPTEFYRLYSKLLPKESKQEIDGKVELVISPILAPSALDGAPADEKTISGQIVSKSDS